MTRRYADSAGRQCDVLRALQRGDQAGVHNLILNSPGTDWHAALDGRYCPSLTPPHSGAGEGVAGRVGQMVQRAGVVVSTPKKRKKAA